MSGPVIVAGVRPAMTVEQQLLAALRRALDAGIGSDGRLPSPADQARAAIACMQPQRDAVWPFPPADADARDRMARKHQAQQRGAVVNGPEALL